MKFEFALAALRHGARVNRTGWNAPGQFVYLVGPGRYAPSTATGEMIASRHPDGLVPYRPYFALLTAQGDVVPWQPTVSDVLAEDWEGEG